MSGTGIDIDMTQALARVDRAIRALTGPQVMRAVAGTLQAEAEANFLTHGRGAWKALAASTIKDRARRGRTALDMLLDSQNLRKSVSTGYGADYATISAGGASAPYARIQQFGGTIEHAAHSGWVRLRTDRKGNLIRQGGEGREANLAVFAREKGPGAHKQYTTRQHTTEAYTTTIPARPYLPFVGGAGGSAATLQPEAERSVLDVVNAMLAREIGGG